jgi:flagellar M-ring protein FliF
MGFSKARGDTLNVVNAAFTGPAEAPPPKPLLEDPEAMLALAGQNVGNVAVALLIAYLVFGVLRPAIRQLSTLPEPPALAGSGLPDGMRMIVGEDGQAVMVGPDGQPLYPGASAEPASSGADASTVALSDEARAQAEAEERFNADIEVAKFIARKDPRLFAEVLRGWMNNG